MDTSFNNMSFLDEAKIIDNSSLSSEDKSKLMMFVYKARYEKEKYLELKKKYDEEPRKFELADVELVMNVSKSSFDKALDALEKSNGDIVIAACLLNPSPPRTETTIHYSRGIDADGNKYNEKTWTTERTL